jgi:hypothetical protein
VRCQHLEVFEDPLLPRWDSRPCFGKALDEDGLQAVYELCKGLKVGMAIAFLSSCQTEPS